MKPLNKKFKDMAFIQHCFIRKNTTEIKNKLKELGYRHNPLDDDDREWIAVNYGMFISVDEGFQKLPLDDIDCGTNEDLFFALASLQDDTNENQWFIAQRTMWDENYNGEITVYYEEGEWLLWDYYSFMEDIPSDFRKATVEEIITHFNNM